MREILANHPRPPKRMTSTLSEADEALAFCGEQILRVALEQDVLEAQGRLRSRRVPRR